VKIESIIATNEIIEIAQVGFFAIQIKYHLFHKVFEILFF